MLTFFAGPSTSVEVDAPLGTYKLKYGCGTAWYGTTPMFGEAGRYYEADDTFIFSMDAQAYHGHELTLYAVANGNLSTHEISMEDF